ncbi:glycoside hydrolase family 43 protein [Actinoallomurus vinaceus]|uniref:Glycoside hydrolase family 43 protein n=1 Tax=Actinoallomurus vinaceus TaxID=1080074 RepID=A0ABP8UQ90_9ACTN
MVAVGAATVWAATDRDAVSPAVPTAVSAQAAAGPKLVIPSNFPDPGVIKVGTTFYAYATNSHGKNMPVASAPSARGPWSILAADGLPRLGKWATTGRTWAPAVTRRKDGKFLLYYAARNAALKRQCVGVAVASSPVGPFAPSGSKPLVCNAPAGAKQGKLSPEIIDAGSYEESSRRYLLYKVGYNQYHKPSFLALQRMSADGLQPVGKPKVILKQTNEPYTVEAPELVHRQGEYVLFYSAGVFSKDNYQTRYAVASSLGGPYKKAAKPLMTTAGFGRKVNGPGGADVVWDAGTWRIFFHGAILVGPPPKPDPSPQPKNLQRGMYEADLRWSKGGLPYVQ